MLDTRKQWLSALLQITGPVLDALAAGKLKERLPVSIHEDRSAFAPLEAFGRSMVGLAPWLEVDSSSLTADEREQQSLFREKAIRCIEMAADPESPDFMVFDHGGQPLVDTAFLAHALVRAPGSLAAQLQPGVRRKLADAFRSSRAIPAHNSNWIFFSAMVEAGLYVLGEDYDILRVLYAARTFLGWYKGDGVYGDGERFHWDYYNSFVIQPMFVDLVDTFSSENEEIARMRDLVVTRSTRYAAILERMIAPDGSFPVIGRSMCYRFGAFQMLAQAALQERLPEELSAASVRCALTAVIERVMSAPGMFDEQGWLLPGVYGYQPELAEPYINIGSLYLCSSVFLPLGIKPSEPFWSAPDREWTGKRVWSGASVPIDHAID